MRKFAIFAALALVAAFGITNAQPGEMGMGDGPGMGPMHGMMLESLNLTDQQWEKIQDLQIQFQKNLIPRQADLKMARLNMKEIMMKPDFSDRSALELQDKISSIKDQIAKMKLQHMLDVRKVLTPDQIKEFMKMHRGGRGPGMKGRGMRGMMGGPMMQHGMGPGMIGHEMMPGMDSGNAPPPPEQQDEKK